MLNDSSICGGEWMKNILVRVLIQSGSVFLPVSIDKI